MLTLDLKVGNVLLKEKVAASGRNIVAAEVNLVRLLRIFLTARRASLWRWVAAALIAAAEAPKRPLSRIGSAIPPSSDWGNTTAKCWATMVWCLMVHVRCPICDFYAELILDRQANHQDEDQGYHQPSLEKVLENTFLSTILHTYSIWSSWSLWSNSMFCNLVLFFDSLFQFCCHCYPDNVAFDNLASEPIFTTSLWCKVMLKILDSLVVGPCTDSSQPLKLSKIMGKMFEL